MIALHVGLAHLERESLSERRAERNFVEEPAVHARDRHGPAFAARVDRLAQRAEPIGREKRRCLHLVVRRRRAVAPCASMPTASMQASGPRPPVIS